MTDAELLKLYQRHGQQVAATARAAKLADSTVRDRLRRMGKKPGRPPREPRARAAAAPPPAGGPRARSLRDFAATYDKSTYVPARITAALKALGQGWLYEHELAKAADLSAMDVAQFREQFAEHVVSTPRDRRRVWFGRVADAEYMRARI